MKTFKNKAAFQKKIKNNKIYNNKVLKQNKNGINDPQSKKNIDSNHFEVYQV